MSIHIEKPTLAGIGMPATLYLQEFGELIYAAFDDVAYHVGSSLGEKVGWRDVDVRLILSDKKYKAMGYGNPRNSHQSAKWRAEIKAWSALGQQMTGLPIDFQIQQQSYANKMYKGARSALMVILIKSKKK